ncbi:hypothetical protein V502_10725 [Pseudogymnoascus sp. VKM F-4520 (FW-2644)]|nr:hypothetical protein V502_10725 [Pseudogymnoascus sp. VKM F-4520 (FW-2644)]
MAASNSLGNFFFVSGPDYSCPGMPFKCEPPSACSRDPTTGRFFCCDPKSVCYAGTTTCSSDSSTFQCGTKSNAWCCTSDSESCTGTSGQINVCWSKLRDLLLDVGIPVLNKTYTSLSAADPEVTSWSFNPQALIAATDTTSQASSTTPSSSSTPSSSTPSSTATTAAPTTTADDTAAGSSQTPSTPTDVSSSKSLSGGAIGGIVVGAVGALVLVALAVFFLRRRRRNTPSDDKHEGIPWAALPPQPDPAHELSTGHQEPMHELSSNRPVVELPGNEEYRYR